MPLDHYTPRVAIMRDVRYGVGDRGTVCLTFSVDTGTGFGSTLSLDAYETISVLEELQCGDVNKLNGQPMYYTIEDGILRFKGPMLPSPNSEPWDHNETKAREEWHHMLKLQRERDGDNDE